MNETGDYLSALTRRKADVFLAQILQRNDDGTYQCKKIAGGAVVRAARTNASEEYAIGSWVMLGSPSASGAVLGAMHMILTRAPQEQRGLSQTTPDRSEEGFPAAAVLAVVPDPAILPAGGDPVEQVFRGHGFRHAPTYSTSDIEIVGAPVITSEAVTVQIQAVDDSELGEFDATIDGVTVPSCVTIVDRPAEEGGPAATLWALGYDDDSVPHLLRIDAADNAALATFRDYSLDAVSAAPAALAVGDDRALLRIDDAMLAFSFPGGTQTTAASGLAATASSTSRIGSSENGGNLYYPVNAGGGTLRSGAVYIGATDTENVFGPIPNASTIHHIDPDGTSLWLAAVDTPSGLGCIIELDAATAVEIRRVAHANLNGVVRVIHDATHLYIIAADKIRKLLKADLSFTDVVNLGNVLHDIRWRAGNLAILGDNLPGPLGFFQLNDPVTLTAVAGTGTVFFFTLVPTFVQYGAAAMAFDDRNVNMFYVSDTSGGINVFDVTAPLDGFGLVPVIARYQAFPGAAPGSLIQLDHLLFEGA